MRAMKKNLVCMWRKNSLLKKTERKTTTQTQHPSHTWKSYYYVKIQLVHSTASGHFAISSEVNPQIKLELDLVSKLKI